VFVLAWCFIVVWWGRRGRCGARLPSVYSIPGWGTGVTSNGHGWILSTFWVSRTDTTRILSDDIVNVTWARSVIAMTVYEVRRNPNQEFQSYTCLLRL
jgi:hypothetical protein